MFMSTLVIAAKNTNDIYLTQACVRESLAKRLEFMIMKIRMIEKSLMMIFTKGAKGYIFMIMKNRMTTRIMIFIKGRMQAQMGNRGGK